jgi:hypothetical protein
VTPAEELTRAAARCERTIQDRHQGDTPDDRRARALLGAARDQVRAAARAVAADPSLTDERNHATGVLRPVDLLAELTRHLIPLVRHAPSAAGWDEADAVAARVRELADVVAHDVPRPDHATPTGATAIHSARLAAAYDRVATAARDVASAVPAPVLGHSDPRAARLLALAEELSGLAAGLEADYDQVLEASERLMRRPSQTR